MGGNKKFIDKKASATYSLICRANDDGDDPAASLADERVLARVDKRASAGELLEDGTDDGTRSLGDDRSVLTASSSHYTRSGRLTRARRAELIELGFPDDGYDYLQHCRVIGASGGAGATFVPVVVKPVLDDDERVYDAREAAKPTAVTAMQVEDSAKVARNAELAELVEAMREARMMAVEHTPRGEASASGAAAPDASSELEGDDVLVAGDLEDDFILSVLDADALPLHGGAGLDTVLEALTEDEGSDGTDRDLGESEEEDLEEHSGGAPPDDVLASSAAQQRARRAQRQVDDAFDALAAAEYDSDDIGELDESDPSHRGRADVTAYGAVLDAFRSSAEGATALAAARAAAQADRLADGLSSGSDGEEFSSDLSSDEDEEEESPEERESKLALQVTRLRLGLPLSGRLRTQGDEEVIEHLTGPAGETALKDDDVMELQPIDVHGRDRNPWDCDTIVSTYSNAENRPRVLDDGAPARRAPRTGSRAAANVSSAPQVIRLGKTGLPVDYLPPARHAAATSVPAGEGDADGAFTVDVASDAPWRAQTRRKGESAEEKRARKAAVKEGRREARATKKDTKLLFLQEAKATRPAHVTGAVRPGTSVTPLL